MSEPTLSGVAPAPSLDPRLRHLLRDLPEAQAALVEALVRERDALVALAERRAERLRRLQEVSATLSRSLDREEIERELARQVSRMVQCAGVVVTRHGADGENGVVGVHWRMGDACNGAIDTPADRAVGEVARTGRASRDADGSLSVLAVPLMIGYRLAGVLAVYGEDAGAFGSEEEELLQTIGATAATALVNASLFDESVRERRQSEALTAVASSLGSSLKLADVLRLSLRHAMAILGAGGAAVSLRRGEFLHVVASEGATVALHGLYVPIAGSAAGTSVLEARPVIINSIKPGDAVYHRTRELARVENVVNAPLMTPTGPIGLLTVTNRAADFTDDDARVLQRLASQLALAVVNARLYEEASDLTRELSAAFDATAGGMAVLDSDGFVVRHNATLAVCAGLAEGERLDGRGLYELLTREARPLTEDDPLGIAVNRREVGRGTIRQAWSGKVFDIVASPHPAGGAVVTVDDVTTFHALSERYRLVVESTTDAILIAASDGTIEFANDAAELLFAPVRTLPGTRLVTLVPDEMKGEIERHIARVLGGSAMRFNGEVLRRDGERRVVSMSLAPVRDGGTVRGLVVSLRDVSDETRARDEVAAANARYRNLVEMAADAIYTLDRQGELTSANAASDALSGVPRDQMIGTYVFGVVDPAERDAVLAHFAATLRGETRRYECHILRADGTRRLISVSNTPIRRGGAVSGVLGVARDLTDDRDRAVRLEQAEARYARLVESAEDAICTVDETGNFTTVNRALERVFCRTRDALVGSHFTTLLAPAQRATMLRMFTATLAGARQREELHFRSASGATRIATVISAPIYEHGGVAGVLAILRDVTEERALLEQVVRREKLAALGEMVGGVAHEVNSPLTGILAFGQILQAGNSSSEDRRKAADTIVTEAKRAARIVSKLLTFARQNPSERMPTDLNQVLRDTIELRQYPLRMQHIVLETAFDDALPVTSADPFQLQQVFINLLSNAEQALAGHPGDRRVTVSTERSGDWLVATVADTGSGIAPEHLAHIFNPFHTTKPRGIGTGLGLAISFGIVREHGGTVRVRSEPGCGAAFEVVLPIVAPLIPGNA